MPIETSKLTNDELLCSERLREAIDVTFQRLYLKALAAKKPLEAETDEEQALSARDRAARELHRVVGLVTRRVTGEA